ncbi:MAG: glutathione S-transferase family protein [Proteobacteria bacterium]|jgi:glutathione S-transferase|nr:glutathione S-transferase family protein [Pseudomonadota bacterium]MDA1237550.1 glutathione S-transferase family protein [Pseudomonadota bacterium]
MAELKLIYFKMRALAETPQMIMHYAGIKYSYIMAWDFYKKPWGEAKESVPFNQLPVLVINDKTHVSQSGSIVRYVAKLANIVPDNEILAAEVDAVFETTQEMFFPLNPTINFAVGEDYEKKRAALLEGLSGTLSNFERILKRSSGTYFFGSGPYYCDFGAYHHISLAQTLDKNLLDDYPNIKLLMHEIETLPGVISYLKNRPTLVGVGEEPKLVIDGVARKTGVTKD